MAAPCPLFGFVIELDVAATGASRAGALIASLDSMLARRGLVRQGGAMGRHWSCTILSEAAQVTDADRDAVQDWASGHPEIATIRIGGIADLRGA